MIIIIQCEDRAGLLTEILDVFAGESIRIISTHEYRDTIEHLFYVRIETEIITDLKKLKEDLYFILPVDATVKLRSLPEKKVIVLVSKEYHCLADILIRNQFKTLGASVQCVIGNHASLQNICERFEIPFHLVSHENQNKTSFENQLLHTIDQYDADYLVLAKFMRILSPEFTSRFHMRIINIHHSFLPAFVGANPYRQAFHRGVKLIGATAHFVTSELDEGPIIAQQAIPISHSFTPADMVKVGREIETAVLAKALQVVFDDRVFIHQNKTIVLE